LARMFAGRWWSMLVVDRGNWWGVGAPLWEGATWV
jgi:hypothetical protein